MKHPILILAGLTHALSGAIIHNETNDGDLSGNFSAPTALNLSLGANTIIAQMGNNGNTGATNGRDADYFSFILGPGTVLTSLTIDSYTFSPNNPGSSFAGFTSGNGFTGQGNADIDGGTLFNASSGDILDNLAGAPLGEGTYSFWFQETSANLVDYQITLNTSQIPEPSSLALGGLALLATLSRRKR